MSLVVRRSASKNETSWSRPFGTEPERHHGRSDMSKKKQDKKEKGGLGRFVVLLLVFVAVAGAAFWYLAPDEFQDQVDKAKGLIGN